MAQNRVRVLALSPIPLEGAGCRFRIAQYVPYLREVGFDVTISPFYTPEFFRLVYRKGQHLRKAISFLGLTWHRVRELLDVGGYDLVFLYREAIPLGPPIVERLIAARGIPIVYDFDDAIFLPNVSEANRSISFLKAPGRTAELVRRSTRVVAGNSFLGDYARRHNPNVTVIPTAVDTDYFVPRADSAVPPGHDLKVGWIGSPTTFAYLEDLADTLRAVAAQHRFVLKVSGAGRRVHFPGLAVDETPWALADEVTLFNTCDVGVYPLTDDEWSKGKCGFKAIQFMACGVPVVASAVGVNREIIRDGENGFLASTPQEWTAKLGRLLTDPGLRADFARAGRRTIEERYSLRVTAPQLAAVMTDALHAGGAHPSKGPR